MEKSKDTGLVCMSAQHAYVGVYQQPRRYVRDNVVMRSYCARTCDPSAESSADTPCYGAVMIGQTPALCWVARAAGDLAPPPDIRPNACPPGRLTRPGYRIDRYRRFVAAGSRSPPHAPGRD